MQKLTITIGDAMDDDGPRVGEVVIIANDRLDYGIEGTITEVEPVCRFCGRSLNEPDCPEAVAAYLAEED